MSNDKPPSRLETDVRLWLPVILSVLVSATAVLAVIPVPWRPAACLGVSFVACLYLWIRREKPRIGGKGPFAYSKRVRSGALGGLVGIPFFLLGNVIIVVPVEPFWQLTSTALPPTQATAATTYALTPTPSPSPTLTPAPTLTPTPITTLTPTPTPTPITTLAPTPTPALGAEIYRTYEWQWAGENWYGRVTLENLNGKNVVTQAKVGLLEKTIDDRILPRGIVLNAVSGTFEVKDKGIDIDLTVDKKNRRTGMIDREIIKGTLNQTQCFAGHVEYSGSSGIWGGDMILVGYHSDVGFQVDDWITNSKDWFGKYLIDKSASAKPTP
jgi:hypothetical protein